MIITADNAVNIDILIHFQTPVQKMHVVSICLHYIQGLPIKNNPLGKIHFLSYCKRFFHQIYSFHREVLAPHTQQISSQ